MAPQLGNYVLETATAPGTGSFTLNGPETSRRSFSAAFPNGGSVFYFADDGSSAEWGVGTLTIGTPSTLSRTTIIGTTSGGTSALNFSGSVEVYNEIPAEYVPILEADGHLIVKSISDWTKRQALGAADADGRYIKSANDSTNTRVDSAGINKQTGVPWLHTGSGFTNLQVAGDYATNTAVAGKVSKSGDTMTGSLTIKASLSVGNGAGWSGGTANGSLRWTTGFLWFGNPNDASNSAFSGTWQVSDLIGNGNDDRSGINLVGYDYQGTQYNWYFPWNGNIVTPKGNVAFSSDISNLQSQINGKQPAGDYVTSSTYNNDFGGSYWNGAAVIHLPFGLKQVSFYVANVHDGQRINYIEGFSANPSSISIQPNRGNVVAHRETISNEDAGGFTIHIYGGYDGIWVTAIGPK